MWLRNVRVILGAAEIGMIDRREIDVSGRLLDITDQTHSGVDAHMLARNAGTSTQMIDRFYSKFVPTSSISTLTPDWLQHRPLTS